MLALLGGVAGGMRSRARLEYAMPSRNPWSELSNELRPLRVALQSGVTLLRERLKRRPAHGFRLDNAAGIGFARSMIEFEGRDVLEIGGCTPEPQALATGCRSWLATDLAGLPEPHDPRYRVQIEDARALTLDDDSIDIVFSISALEHIATPERCLREVRRVLRPGGVFWTNYGPIWSGPIGHHLFFQHEGKRYTFNDGLLEPWEHLRFEFYELEQRLTRRLGPELARLSVASASSDGRNRVHCDDYLRAIQASGLAVSHLEKRRIRVPGSDATIAALRDKYPHNRDFETNGIRMLLQKLDPGDAEAAVHSAASSRAG